MKHLLLRSSTLFFISGLLLGIAGTTIAASARGSSFFPDIAFGTWYDEPVGELYQLGIVKGNDDGTYRPEAPVSRAEVAVMFKRFRDELLGITPAAETTTSVSTRSRRTVTAASSSSAAPLPEPNENGKVRFTVESLSILETRSEALITIVRNEGKTGDISVKYDTASVTAIAGEDFDALSGTLDFRDGQSSATITVRILNDTEVEGDETFKINLSDATGGSELGDIAETVITITDDESGSPSTSSGDPAVSSAGELQFSAMAYAVAESAGRVTITVERKHGTTGAVGVSYATSEGTADNSSDYDDTSGTLAFAEGETAKTFSITVDDDDSITGNKTVKLTLSAPTGGAALGTNKQVILTLIDDEISSPSAGSFRFSNAIYDYRAEDGPAEILVSRMSGSTGEVGISFSMTDGTAISGRDYTPVSGTLTFAEGETQKAFYVPLLAGGDGGVNLKIETPTGDATLNSPVIATLNIE